MMYRVDNDLLSIQQARINVELAREASKEMRSFSQEQLDAAVAGMADALQPQLDVFAQMAVNETDYGKYQDKVIKNRFISKYLPERLLGRRYVGLIKEDEEQRMLEIGVPVGVLVGMIPATSPASTTIHNILIAVKSGNAIVISPHPRAKETISAVVKLMAEAAEKAGLPAGAITCMHIITDKGTQELLEHEDVSLLLATGVPKMIKKLETSSKPYIYGGNGNGPVFIERTCDVKQAVKDVIASRTFDFGMVSAAEQSVVVDEPIAEIVKKEFLHQGAYFMSRQETEALLSVLCSEAGGLNSQHVGKSALFLAEKAKLQIPPHIQVLVYEQSYVTENNPFAQEFLNPVLAYYVEPDWQHACERCIELLMETMKSHTLVIHSKDDEVIRNFALKKPVSRMLVNTPATFGSMGVTTNLFPSMTLGSSALGIMSSSDNISPRHLTTIRKVGYGVRTAEECFAGEESADSKTAQSIEEVIQEILEKMI